MGDENMELSTGNTFFKKIKKDNILEEGMQKQKQNSKQHRFGGKKLIKEKLRKHFYQNNKKQ